jgi:hypothetical protein
MPPQTLLAAFRPDGTWPNIPNVVEADLKAHTPGSGSTTEQTEPPKYHESRPVSDYTNAGQAALVTLQGQLQQNFMPSEEDLFAHRSEADVVRSAALYLLHPVNMALSFRAPRTYKCSSEYISNTARRGNVRSDIVFFRQNGTAMQPMAVLEFKNRGILDHHPDSWNKTLTAQRATGALLTPQVLASAKFGGAIDNVVANAPDNAAHEMTYFDGNPLILVKQAAAYAISYKTKYVALFDWNTLILIHFNSLDIAGNYCGDGIHTTIIRNQAEMRLALLGFLELAHHQP